MSFEHTIREEALKHLPVGGKNLRKRFLVSEGDLFQLYKEIQLIRSKEDKEHLMADFRNLLKEAQLVKMSVEPKNVEL